MIDLTKYTKELELVDGIYYSKKNDSISYPDEGNEMCFKIEDSSFWFKHRNKCISNAVQNFKQENVFRGVLKNSDIKNAQFADGISMKIAMNHVCVKKPMPTNSLNNSIKKLDKLFTWVT